LGREKGGEGFGAGFGVLGIGGSEGDDQFARVGELLLVEFQALDGREIGGEQVENLDIEFEPREAQTEKSEKRQDPARARDELHGRR
jgi:hypothetical protein